MAEDFFQLFQLPHGYTVDINQLNSNYRELQKALHPDRYANASDRERSLAVQQAAQINDGFNTLKDPLARAKYLLQLAAVDLNESANTRMPGAFLMQQMELREQLEAISEQSDPLTAVADLLDQLGLQRKEIIQELGELFDAEGEDKLKQCIELTNALQFFYKLIEEASELEARLEDQP